ncbi:MAG: hypothetical protein WCC36_18605 [Gammaproteobacteria bacterium]
MKAFFKTLFGDLVNMGFVAGVLAVEALLVYSGHAGDAALVVPLLILAGVAWLAIR